MKKCPFCAEEVQDQAVVCKHCKRSLTPMPQPQVSANAPVGAKTFIASSTDWKKVLKVFGVIILVILSFQFWYLTVPGVAIWYLWKKTKFSKKTSVIATAVLVILFAILEGSITYAGRAPTVTITDPQNNSSIQAQTVIIKGKVDPANSIVLVNGNRVPTDGSGNFNYQAQLPTEGNNQVAVKVNNGDKQVASSLTINRIFTDQEKAAKAQVEADAAAKAKTDADAVAAAQAAADAKTKADQAAYDNSPAGRLCAKHLDWTQPECQEVANNKLWVGMTLDMLKVERGDPDHSNPSNVGSGNTWQWCWDNYTPSCFYGGDDGITTSYN